MLFTLLTGALASLALVQQTDTTFAVRQGQRLEVSAHSGSITVRAWNRNAVRVVAVSDERLELDVSPRGAVVAVDASRRHGGPAEVAYQIQAPAWMSLSLSGIETDITVDGAGGPVSVETVQGDVVVRGGNGIITLHSVEGSVHLADARGTIEVGSVNDDVTVAGASGDLNAETVNGDVLLTRIESGNIATNTVNGDITYDGTVRDGGRYHLETHNGDITLTVPERANATFHVSTFSGDFESSFPVTLSGTRRGKRFSFSIGSGSASVQLDSFQGTIQLVRPGAIRARER